MYSFSPVTMNLKGAHRHWVFVMNEATYTVETCRGLQQSERQAPNMTGRNVLNVLGAQIVLCAPVGSHNPE